MITKFLGLDHLPVGIVGARATAYGLAYSDLQARAVAQAASYQIPSCWIEDGKLVIGKAGTDTALIQGLLHIPMRSLIGDVTPNKVIVGFRAELLNRPFSNINIVALSNANTVGVPTYSFRDIAAAAFVAGPSFYELEIDFSTGNALWTIYQDRVQIANGSQTTNITKANIKNLFLSFGGYIVGQSGAAASIFNISNLYAIADLGDANDTFTQRLGPVKVKRLPVAALDGAGWVASTGTVKDALNTRLGDAAGSSYLTPNVASPDNNTPAAISFDPAVISDRRIKALSLQLTPFRDAGVAVNLATSIRQGSDTVAGLSPTIVDPASTPLFDQTVKILTDLPGGLKLTKANLATTQLVLQPS